MTTVTKRHRARTARRARVRWRHREDASEAGEGAAEGARQDRDRTIGKHEELWDEWVDAAGLSAPGASSSRASTILRS
ncbi:hypothetical protein [Pendulispora albinea]|uniref:Uncharacterized protein n=1 Tax=Pendulispora albinea TaxID=2741071 RepID=A0ABZ2MA84_9BACT